MSKNNKKEVIKHLKDLKIPVSYSGKLKILYTTKEGVKEIKTKFGMNLDFDIKDTYVKKPTWNGSADL